MSHTSASKSGRGKPPKQRVVKARIEVELVDQAQAKANRHGWPLAAVIRVLLRRWLAEADASDSLMSEEIAEESRRAPKASRPSAPVSKRRRR